MTRTLTAEKFKVYIEATSGGIGHSSQGISIPKSEVEITDYWEFQGTVASGGTDTYTAANVPNMGNCKVFVFYNHDTANTMTLTFVHGGANTPDVVTVQAEGCYVLIGTRQGTLTSVAVAGTAGDLYTLILAD